MTLKFDPDGRIDAPRLVDLIRAVYGAATEDETNWLEWKKELDLSTTKARFQIAKTILGMANRDVDQAQRWVSGYGYMVVGVAAGEFGTMQRFDMASLDQQVRPWVGSGDTAPRWTPMWTEVEGHDVLVFEIEPPRLGDPVFPLRRRYSKSGKDGAADESSQEPGTAFVRRAASTNQADDEEILQLSARAAGNRQLALSIESASDESFAAVEVADAAVVAEITRRKAILLEPLVPKRQATVQLLGRDEGGLVRTTELIRKLGAGIFESTKAAAAMQAMAETSAFGNKFGGGPDTRTEAKFRAEVEEWAAECRAEAVRVCRGRALEAGVALLSLMVVNNSIRNIPDVIVEAHIAGDVFGEDSHDELPTSMPTEPWPFGKPAPFVGLGGALSPGFGFLANYNPNKYSGPVVRNSGSVSVEWPAIDLRPESVELLDPIALAISPEALEAGDLVVTWSSTSSALDGRLRGTVRVPTVTTVVDAAGLFDEIEEAED